MATVIPIDGRGPPRDHHLTAAVEVCRLDRLAGDCGVSAHRRDLLVRQPKQRRHRAGSGRHRLLHELTAKPGQPDRVGEAKRRGRDQRAPFAEGVPSGDVEPQPLLLLEDPEHGD